MPLVKAIENGIGQTESLSDEEREMWCYRLCFSRANEHEVPWNGVLKRVTAP
jgi:hypothetical protein